MALKYRIRKRSTNKGEQFYVDYKRLNGKENIEEVSWMGGFYAPTEEEARKIIEKHREYEELRERLQMTEDVIYDETETEERKDD